MSSGDEQNIECPLCMEPLEMDDINFFPCTCGYQICRFCWHRIRTDENGLCPACRKQYPEDPADFKPLSAEELQRIKSEKKQKDLQRKQKIAENRKHLANVRVVQRNLVFVVGLPPRLAEAEVLKKHDYFGKFGKIHKVVVNHSTSYAGSQGPSASAYVTYYKAEDALRAIQTVNNFHIDGRTLRASLGTTKYCSHFLKNQQCPKPDCMYLHELGDEAASFTKEEMQQGKHQEYERKLHEQILGVLHSSTNRKQASSPTGQLLNSHMPQKEAWPSFQGKADHKINGLTKNLHLQNPGNGKNDTRLSSGNSKRNRHAPAEENFRGKGKERKERTEKKGHHNHGHSNKVSKHNNKAHKTRTQSPPPPSCNEKQTGGPPPQLNHPCGSPNLKSQNAISGSSSSRSSCSSSGCTSRTDTSSPTSNGSLSTVECIEDVHHHPDQSWMQREQPCDMQQQDPKNTNGLAKSVNAMSESNLTSSLGSGVNSDASSSLVELPQQNVQKPRSKSDDVKGSASPINIQSPVSNCENFESGRVLEENYFNLVGEFPKHASENALHHNRSEWLRDSESAPLITSETIPVSSCTDWQAAFGFDSSQKTQDDDLGFDPWDECTKGLRDLLEKEAGKKPCNTVGMKPTNPTVANTTAYNNIINSHTTNGSLSTDGSQFPRRVAAPPPGFAPNHGNPYANVTNRSTYSNDIPANKMMHYMNMHHNQPVMNNHLIMNTPVYREPHFPQNMSVVSNHKEPILSQGLNSMRAKGCDVFSMKEWQEELRALLPNVNISFGPPSQQLPNQVPQNQKVWSAHLSEMPGMTRDPAILSTGVLSDSHSGSPPHWMKSLQQLTVDDEPTGFKNRSIAYTTPQFPYRASQWAPAAHQPPPPGFGMPINPSFRPSEPQAVAENL